MIQLQLDSLISLTAAVGFFSDRNFFCHWHYTIVLRGSQHKDVIDRKLLRDSQKRIIFLLKNIFCIALYILKLKLCDNNNRLINEPVVITIKFQKGQYFSELHLNTPGKPTSK